MSAEPQRGKPIFWAVLMDCEEYTRLIPQYCLYSATTYNLYVMQMPIAIGSLAERRWTERSDDEQIQACVP